MHIILCQNFSCTFCISANQQYCQTENVMPHYSPTAHVFSELDGLAIDGESRLLLYSRGRTQEEFPYSRTSLTTGEKSLIFAAWSVLDENGVLITYHMSLPDQAPVIAIHCGFDEMGRSFGYYYIRPVENEENGGLQDTVDKRIVCNGYSNLNAYVEWVPLSDYWYQGTTAMVLYE